MALETTMNSVEDKLIDGLSYQLEPGAKYITNKRSVKFYPQGSNIYKSRGGTKMIKIMLNGDEFLDPNSVRVSFDLKNEDTQLGLLNVGGPWTFFRRLTIKCGGTTIEDIDYYGRTHEMFHKLLPKDVRKNEVDEGFGFELNLSQWQRDNNWTAENKPAGGSVRLNNYRTVSFKPLAGLFNQPKMIPLQFCPLSIELELTDNAVDALVETVPKSDPGHTYDANSLSEESAVGALSQVWRIENPVVLCDLVSIDNQLMNEYSNVVLSGRNLPISYSTLITQLQSLSSGNNGSQSGLINVTRAVSRLQSAFVTFSRSTDANGNRIIYEGRKVTDVNTSENKLYSNDLTEFYGPHTYNGGQGHFDPSTELEFQLQIGSKKFPESEIKSTSEAFYNLRKTMGVHASSNHSMGIDMHEYLFDNFIVGIDTEKSMQASGTGENLKSGQLISLKYKFTDSTAAHWPKQMYITLHSQQLLEIGATGVQVYD